MIMGPKKQIKCSFIMSEEYKLYNKNTSSKYNWEYSKSFTLACCNVTWCIQWKRYALDGPLHFSNSNSTFCHYYLLFPNYRYVQRNKKKKKKERKVVMEGSKKILQSAHTTGPPYSLFQSHFIRLNEYGGGDDAQKKVIQWTVTKRYLVYMRVYIEREENRRKINTSILSTSFSLFIWI